MTAPALTASDMLARIKYKYPPPAYVVLSEVRDGTGFHSAGRSADAIAFGTWPSRGLSITGFEVKISRSDWRREITKPKKAESISQYCDDWYLVAPGVEIIPPEEVPKAWGLMVPRGKGLKVVKAPESPKAEEIDRLFLMSVLRNFSKSYVPRHLLDDAHKEKEERAEERAKELAERATREAKRKLDARQDLVDRVKKFEQISGINLANEWGFPPEVTGRIVHLLASGQFSRQLDSLERIAETLTKSTKEIRDLDLVKAVKR